MPESDVNFIPGFQNLAGTTRITGQSSFVPVQAAEYQNATDVYIDWKRGTFQVLKLIVPTTNVYLVNPINGQTCSILLIQDNVGNRLVEWKANYLGHAMDINIYPTLKWMGGGEAPSLTTDADTDDMVSLKWLDWPIKCYWAMYTLGMT